MESPPTGFFACFILFFSNASCVNGRPIHILWIESSFTLKSLGSSLNPSALAGSLTHSRVKVVRFVCFVRFAGAPFLLFSFPNSSPLRVKVVRSKEKLAAGLDPSLFRSNSSIFTWRIRPQGHGSLLFMKSFNLVICMNFYIQMVKTCLIVKWHLKPVQEVQISEAKISENWTFKLQNGSDFEWRQKSAQ